LAHTAANICLFPPLFFFSALYYTDVASVLFVLLSFINFCDWRAQGWEVKFGWPVLWHIGLGLVSLWFRQTNVFWVGVFPAGLAVVELVRRAGGKKGERIKVGATFVEVVNKSWKKGLLYDPAVGDAWAEGLCSKILPGANH
jgi:alpha-1,2-glucosyltransferase